MRVLYGLAGILVVAAVAGAGYFGYRYLENEKKEVEQAKLEKSAEDNSVLGQARQALAKNPWTSGNLKVSYSDQTRTLFITDETEPGGGLDQELAQATPRDIVQQSYNLLIRAGEAVFEIEGIENIEFVRKVPLNQGSGIVTPTQVVKISAEAEKFKSVDWTELRGQPVHNALATATKVEMHQGFQRSLGNINTLILVRD